ncbi:MAG: YHS domain-containing protein [Patescibacteria group bacterium]
MFNFIKKIFSQEGKEKDPICGMSVDTKTTQYKSTYNEKSYYFCSEHCKKQFDEDPKLS